jgi:farnesyl-diphosphate farnesyltransferase
MKTRDLLGPLLRSVSRSFYLSIAVLPGRIRRPVGIAYLLARAGDTIADAAETPAPVRLEGLQRFREMLATGNAQALPAGIKPANEGEQTLLRELPACFQLFRELDAEDGADVREVLGHILRGQEQDITRNGPIETDAELDEYAFLVAGCVGVFWTRICLRHKPGCSQLNREEMEKLGLNFGKGLQLVNILRDQPGDIAAGRQYLSGDDAAVKKWSAVAADHFDDAFRYIESLRPARLRMACILPWWIGLRTLALMQKTPPRQTTQRVKVPRAEVKRMLITAWLPAFSNRLLRRVRENPGFLLAPTGPVS